MSARRLRTRVHGAPCWVHPQVAAGHGIDAAGIGPLYDLDGPDAELLKLDTRTRVTAVGEWVFKRYRLAALKAWAYQRVRRTPAWREWRGSEKLRAAGVRCVRPLALIHRPPGQWSQVLILPRADGQPLDRFLDADRPDRHRALAEQVGRQIAQMLNAGLVNRDHKAANLVVDADAAAGRRPPVVVDAGGVRRYRNVGQVRRLLALLDATTRPHGSFAMHACVAAIRQNVPALATCPLAP